VASLVFGPTLAAEKLSELHGLDLGVETLRQWMIGAGLWVRRKDRLKRIHQPRARRDCLGELVQIDGSEHWWFEDRGPQCTLLVYIDDATSRLMHLKFVQTESTFDHFQATREYLEAHGKPVAFYSDKHGVFRVNSIGAVQGDGMTQFGRSLHALNIDILCANTPQAKAASSAPTRPCRIAWSRNCVFRASKPSWGFSGLRSPGICPTASAVSGCISSAACSWRFSGSFISRCSTPRCRD
jgi:hypothetical protein